MDDVLIEDSGSACPVIGLGKADFDAWAAGADERVRAWVASNGFTGDSGTLCVVPAEGGGLGLVLAGLGGKDDPWIWAQFPSKLPPGDYRLQSGGDGSRAALTWALAAYSFGRYKTKAAPKPRRLVWPADADRAWVTAAVTATTLVRDLINTPAADLGPAELAASADRLAAEFGAVVHTIVGDGLLAANYPCLHAVGRAAGAARQPRLIDLVWGDPSAPKVTLVGKGVCFDTGGLDLKSSANMKLMKKDMGGAAHVLGLASMVMAAALPVRLRVLIPAVENSVSGDAMRPLDVLATRKGVTVEIGDTDAEGRLILADALWEAGLEKPDLLIDMATLTGAARAALGPDLPALFTPDENLAQAILTAAEIQADPVWRLPLHKPYRAMLDSKVADLSSVSSSSFGGAITAALFLAEFVPPGTRWAHFDLMAWNTGTKPGRPEGGEAMAMRAVFAMLTKRYPSAGSR